MRHLIKNLMTVFVAVSMVLCFVGTSFAYTYDSELNPEEFSTGWITIEKTWTSPFGGIARVKNPDPNARIKEAQIEILNQGLISYEYVIDGKTYKYKFNYETENYDLIVPNE